MRLNELGTKKFEKYGEDLSGKAGDVAAVAGAVGIVGLFCWFALTAILACVAAPILIPVAVVYLGYKLLTGDTAKESE